MSVRNEKIIELRKERKKRRINGNRLEKSRKETNPILLDLGVTIFIHQKLFFTDEINRNNRIVENDWAKILRWGEKHF